MSLRSAFANMPKPASPVAAQPRRAAFAPVRLGQDTKPVQAPKIDLLPGQHPRVSMEVWERVHPGYRDRVNRRASWFYRCGKDFDDAVLAALAEIEAERAVTGAVPVDVEPVIETAAKMPVKAPLPSAGLLDNVFS